MIEKRLRITGAADYFGEIEIPENENTNVYACIKRIELVKEVVVFSHKRNLVANIKRIITGDPES